jgi:hypothetical protein
LRGEFFARNTAGFLRHGERVVIARSPQKSGLSGARRSESAIENRHQTLCRSRHWFAENPARRQGCGREVNNRRQKTAVNPLTGLASRSVMHHNYQSPHVEGPAAIFDPSLHRTACQNCLSGWRLQQWITGLAHRRTR